MKSVLEKGSQVSQSAKAYADRLAYLHDIANFLIQVDGLKESVQREGLSFEQKAVLKRAKDAIAHFAACIEEIEKHR
ncbi:MAG: hypothetical protein DCF15_13410 [Phormidesmis priestleyi]|uniref:Uncharacterized protein n=1 Tax=Phormidesmis priestleyi TaxID=268141 RepID=A0A2W4ZCN0_9CYAN|nr:MAG: hypothetical protein DCF15_13410 [Phormidesmis priestleyi]